MSKNEVRVLGSISQPRLQRLNLDSNKINSLEGFVGLDCKSLRQLILSNNRLTSLEGLRELPVLEELYLASNEIKSLRGLGGFKKLKKLHLRGNKFTGFDFVPMLDTVEYLNLRDNQIETQPEAGGPGSSGSEQLAKLGEYDEENAKFCFHSLTKLHM